MRESNDKINNQNQDTTQEELFNQTKSRDISENPNRYLSSYDLEKRRKETQPVSPRRETSDNYRVKGNQMKETSGQKKSLPKNQSCSRKQSGGNLGGNNKSVGGKKKSSKAVIIGIVAVILIIAAIVTVFLFGKDKKDSTPAETKPVAAEKTYTDVFEDTLFFGNSYFITLKTYDLPQGGHFLCKVGLSINQALEYSGDEDLTVIDTIKAEGYGHIVLAFGENELGWPSEQTFIDEYTELIQAIRDVSPDMKIYVLSVLPVSAAVSQKDEDNTNNPRIREFNEYIRIMAENNDVVYIPPTVDLYDSELNLKSEDSTDGVHLSYEYAKLWVEDIKAIMEREEE